MPVRTPPAIDDDGLTATIKALIELTNPREKRRFVEVHPELLNPGSMSIFGTLAASLAEHGEQERVQRLHEQLELLRDIQARDGGKEAIREAYINMYGGLLLDLPLWLEAVVQQIAHFYPRRQHTQEAAELADKLRIAIAQAQGDPGVAPETIAELERMLGNTLRERLLTDRAQACEAAIEAYESAVQIYTLARYPRQYAMIQYNLGLTYQDRVEGERKTNLEQALTCYQAALQVYTREAFPIDWGTTQHNLGDVYYARIEGERSANLEQAIACYRAALQVYTREASPIEWANIQLSFGNAYYERTAGERSGDVEECILCYQAALQVYTREAFPVPWAVAQNNLGIAYQDRIEGSRNANLEQAIACYENALQIRTREASPMRWAMIQYNLGEAFYKLHTGERSANLEEAIACYKAALQVYTREAFPAEWAMTQLNLGNAYCIGLVGERSINLEQAVACYKNALQVYTREAFPAEWAMIQSNLGNIYQDRVKGERRANIECAIVCYEAALQVCTREASQVGWAAVQLSLGHAYRDRIEGIRRANLEQAIACYEKSSQIYTRTAFPEEWALIQHSLGNAFSERIEGERRKNQEQAITCYKRALQVYTRETFPFEWALTLHNLGNTFSERLEGERHTNQEQAITYYKRALQVYTREAFPAEWARIQHSLGAVYRERIEGEQKANVEQAIDHYINATQVYTPSTFPMEWAAVQHSLGNTYAERIEGEQRTNLEQAIACYEEALRVRTRQAFPTDWAASQHNLGNAYARRIAGEPSNNLEQAIVCYEEALLVYTREEHPVDWAMTQHSLGTAYIERMAEERRANVEQAIACYKAALQVYTREAFPTEWAMVLHNFGAAYRERLVGERQANLKQAVVYYSEALKVRSLDAFPGDHRRTQLAFAFVEAERGNWEAAQSAFASARAAEDRLVRLGAGMRGRDVILKQGQTAVTYEGFSLTRLSRLEAAAVAVERGRARGLSEALMIDDADPKLIGEPGRRTRYEDARRAFISAQVALNDPHLHTLTEDEQRRAILERTGAYHKALDVFDEVVAEVRAARDPSDFLEDSFDAAKILLAAASGGAGHALVYLMATPWGGVAIAALSANPRLNISTRFATLDLPRLTEIQVRDLLETRLNDKTRRIIGGYAYAQEGSGFDEIKHYGTARTFREAITSLHEACIAIGQTSTLDAAAQELLGISGLLTWIDRPFDDLDAFSVRILKNALGWHFLRLELRRCLEIMAEVAMRPLIAWLREQEATSLTLIPCGQLAAFPLAVVPLTDSSVVGDVLATSAASNARSLLRSAGFERNRSGVYAAGNPKPTHQELKWSEAEVLTLVMLARSLGIHSTVEVQQRATRAWLARAMGAGYVVDVACHGTFNTINFLLSALHLAKGQSLTLAAVLNREIDLRGLRLLILSACQTAVLDLRGAVNEVRSLAMGMVQAGARAVLASLWSVDDQATYLLVVRFAQEWLPSMDHEPPARALARAQYWLRTVTNRELQQWRSKGIPAPVEEVCREAGVEISGLSELEPLMAEHEQFDRYNVGQAEFLMRAAARPPTDLTAQPYADPIYWAGFQIIGW